MRQSDRYAFPLPTIELSPGSTNDMIPDARRRFVEEIAGYKGNWPPRPSARRALQQMEALRVGDRTQEEWRVVRDVLEVPAHCARCQGPPEMGFYTLEETHDKRQIGVCGGCLRVLAGPGNERVVVRYWKKVGQHLRNVSHWRDLMVSALLWLEIHRNYEEKPGVAREQWATVARLYSRYIRFGFLSPANAETLYLLVSERGHDAVIGDSRKLEEFLKTAAYSTREQRYLAELLSPKLYRHLSAKARQQVNRTWHATMGDHRRIGPRRMITLTKLHQQVVGKLRRESRFGRGETDPEWGGGGLA